MPYTTQNLVDEVRSLLDESDPEAIDTLEDALPALNRGQLFAWDILARKYPEPILTYTTLTVIGGTSEYDIPENVFEDRILKVEFTLSNNTQREVKRISFRDISDYESNSAVTIPYYYCIVGRKIRFTPPPSGTYSARIWFVRSAEPLVLPQGRITLINSGSNYVIVDQIGSNIDTAQDSLESYVNLIDGQTGVIKGTMQVQNASDNRVTFRSSPTRTLVANRAVVGVMPTIQQDDYLASVAGTCVPFYGSPITNFLIQFAAAELTRKLGNSGTTEEALLDKFEKQVSRTWVGREHQMRIQRRSRAWGAPTTRYWNRGDMK